MRNVLTILAGFARTTLFVVITAAVVLWLAGSAWGQPLRDIIAGSAHAAAPTASAVPLPTASGTPVPTATASATLVPTQTATPTATPFVVQREVVLRAMSNKWTMIGQSAFVETRWHKDTSANRSRFDNWLHGSVDIEATSAYDVSAGMDFNALQVLVNAGNQITITLPPAHIVAVDEREDQRAITATRNGIPYTFERDGTVETDVEHQIGVEMAADAQQKACREHVLDRATEHAASAVKEWVLQIHPTLRYQDISVITAPGVCR